MMADVIIWKPLEVENEVEALGLDVAGLIDCVRYAERERSFVTKNDAIGFANFVVYDKAGRAMREKYLGAEWLKDDSHNQCAIKNPRLKVRVVPCNFDEAAGDRLVRPTNRSPKGRVSKEKSACNLTAWLPGFPKIEPALDDDGFQTWLLGIFSEDDKMTTAELSLPIAFDEKHFTDFGKRIMLITRGDYNEGGRLYGAGNGGDAVEIVDIQIRRK